MKAQEVAIIGAGLGGLTAAAAMQARGFKVQVYEQAEELGEIGAGITIPPNATRVFKYFGLEQALENISNIPERTIVKHYATGKILLDRPRENYLDRFGCNYYFTHRADVHALLADLVQDADPECIHLGHRLTGIRNDSEEVLMEFENGLQARASLAIGCDGVHSVVRDQLFETEAPFFTGQVAYRSLIPWAPLMDDPRVDLQGMSRSAMMNVGPDHWIIVYPARAGELFNCVAMVKTPEWQEDGWSNAADIGEILHEYNEFHEEVQVLLSNIPTENCYKWGMFVRKPMLRWSRGRVVLLGDAAHSMLNFLGQGAAMAIEDAVVLARCLEAAGDHVEAFDRYERARLERVMLVQEESDARGPRLQTHRPDDYDNRAHRNDEDLGLFDYDAMNVAI